MLSRVFRVHFVGIGGIGMSGIAEVLLVQGWPVSGSDTRPSPITSRLMEMGARIVIGHAAANLGDAEVVVTSSAVAADNPEVAAARERQIPVIPRAEMLAELMRLKFGVAVAGMHGKTTTTSMIATVLAGVGLDPTVIVGGRLDSIGSNAKLGTTQYLVAEADESDRSFLQLSPIVAVITNLDREHLDCYRDLEDIQDAFVAFANRVPFYGTVLVGAEDDATRAILPRLRRRALVYGTAEDADLQVVDTAFEGGDSRFRLTCSAAGCHLLGTRARGDLGAFAVPRPGLHNVLDATAAIAVGLLLGGELEAVRAAIGNFRGVDRRFQIRGQADGITVIDDYGHHPTELAATLAAARHYQAATNGRVLMLFQPHRYTRTFHLMDAFAATLARADQVWLLDIYPAGEAPIEGVHSGALARRANEQHGGRVAYIPDADGAIAAIAAAARPGDLILTQGAGSVSGLGDKLLQALAGAPKKPDIALQTSSL
ncbi:MAG TPA: UDP-N-acetylmuramate--L-alanine ligase [Terriglobales bacterium]|nr:UDP-N-acetylmuramate--L-alanine ligase [Terriglobales bacterium]